MDEIKKSELCPNNASDEQAKARVAVAHPEEDSMLFAPSVPMVVTNENNGHNDDILDHGDRHQEADAESNTENAFNLVSPQEPVVTHTTPADMDTTADGSAMMDDEKGREKDPIQNPSQDPSKSPSQKQIRNIDQVQQEQTPKEHHDDGKPEEQHASVSAQYMALATSEVSNDANALEMPPTTVAVAQHQSVVERGIGDSHHANVFLTAATAAYSRPMTHISPAAAAAVANSPAERRGSGFLLLAAEAYEAAERTQLRADAIRQVAMDLASAAGAQAAAADTSSRSGGKVDGGGASAEPSPRLQQGLQRQYEDARFSRGGQTSSFLQGLASGGQQQRQQQQQSMHSTFAQDASYSDVNPNFREQVYMAAARMQMQQQQGAQTIQAQAPAAKTNQCHPEEVSQSLPQSSSQKSTNKRRRRSSGGSISFKANDVASCEPPPLPPAPLVPPTKQPFFKRSNSEAGESTKDDISTSAAADRSIGGLSSDMLPSGKPRPKPLKHVYHDYGSIPDSEHFVRKKTGGVTMPFPEKLMRMLDKETVLHPQVVSWQPHGRAFMVRHPKRFTSEVMGGYFRQSKLTSFQRQLNLYGFRRITQGLDAGAYYHELFLKGRPQLCIRMQRQKVKGTGHKQPTDVTSEPNFYVMPPLIREGEQGGGTACAVEGSGGYGRGVGGSGNSTSPVYSLPKGMGPSTLAPPGGTALRDDSENTVSSFAASATLRLTSMVDQENPFNSPGIRAATMLSRLSASNISALPPLNLDGSGTLALPPTTASQDNIAQPISSSKMQHGYQPTLSSCAKANAAAAAMTAMGNGSDHGSSSSASAV